MVFDSRQGYHCVQITPLSRAGVKNAWSYTINLSYVFIALSLSNHNENFKLGAVICEVFIQMD